MSNINSNANYYSNANFYSNANHNSNANFYSDANYNSNANFYSDANYNSDANYKCRAMYKTMFCYKQTGKAYMIFNKQLTEDKYNEIVNKIEINFKKVRWTNAIDILNRLDEKEKVCLGEELEKENDDDSLKNAWKPVLDQLKELTKLDIWDAEANEVVEKITGYDLNEECKIKEEPIIIDGKKFSKETIKNALKAYIN